jgi:hypothetical protein
MVALALILLAGAELLACDLLSTGACNGNDCLCCCPHVELTGGCILLQPELLSAPVFTAASEFMPDAPLRLIVHPPRG